MPIPPLFFNRGFALSPKSLLGFCICSIVLSVESIAATPQGFVEGHLRLVSLLAAQDSDEMPRAEVAPANYANYPLVVLSASDKKEIAHITADQNGNYRTALPPGAYILDVQGRGAKRLRATPQEFTVAANQTVRVDMSIIVSLIPAAPDHRD